MRNEKKTVGYTKHATSISLAFCVGVLLIWNILISKDGFTKDRLNWFYYEKSRNVKMVQCPNHLDFFPKWISLNSANSGIATKSQKGMVTRGIAYLGTFLIFVIGSTFSLLHLGSYFHAIDIYLLIGTNGFDFTTWSANVINILPGIRYPWKLSHE